MKQGWLVGGVVLLVLAGCQSAGTSGASTDYPKHFASEDHQTDDSLYSVAWTALLGDCRGSASLVERQIDAITDEFAAQGQPTSHLDVMTDVAEAAEPVAPTFCDQIGAALLTMSSQ